MKYVIIGNSAAGIGAVEGIRKVDGHGSISIVSNEGELPYSRPLISYWLSGQAAEDKLNYREKSFYNDHQCQLFAGRTAMQVDAVNKSVTLDDGSSLIYDRLCIATGVRPNTGLLNGIAEIDRGIIVDDHGRTTAADIFAAGDCSQTTDVSDGQSKVMALMPNAYLMGECAGINMAGGNHSFSTTIPMNAVGFFGLHIITAGNYIGDIYEEQDSRHYKRLFAQHDRLKGYMLIGDIERAGIYTRLIRQQIPLHTIDYPLICERPGLIAFSSQERQAMLGGPQ